jgi:hypothetical protein
VREPSSSVDSRSACCARSGSKPELVQLSFLLESLVVTLTAVLVGTILGIWVAINVIQDSAGQPGWENLTLRPPWMATLVILVVVLLSSLVHDVATEPQGLAHPTPPKSCATSETSGSHPCGSRSSELLATDLRRRISVGNQTPKPHKPQVNTVRIQVHQLARRMPAPLVPQRQRSFRRYAGSSSGTLRL